MTDAVDALQSAMNEACARVDAVFRGEMPKVPAVKPELADELNALLVMAKGIAERHAYETARTKFHICEGIYHCMTKDMEAIVESIEEALHTYENATIHLIR